MIKRKKEKTYNRFAIAGFILSFFMGVLGLIFSIIGLVQINKTKQKGKGLAISGIIISGVLVFWHIMLIVIVSLYFVGGMQALWEKTTGVGGTYNEADVTSARQLCRTFCVVEDEQPFCATPFNLKKGDVTEVKYCDQFPIEAQKSPDCTNFEDLDCSQYRTIE